MAAAPWPIDHSRVWLIAVLALASAGCGRLAFDESSSGDGGSASSDTVVAADAEVIPAGAVLWAPLDDSGSTQRADVAGNHLIDCLGTVCPALVGGKHGGAAHFDGGPMSELAVGYRADLDSASGFSAALWVKLDSYATTFSFACLLSKPFGPSSADSYGLCVQDSGEALFYSADVAATDDYLLGPKVSLGVWHHLAVTWDGMTKRGYLDGALVATSSVTTGGDTTNLVIGGDNNAGNYVYQPVGAIDDVIIYGRALSPAEVAQLAQ